MRTTVNDIRERKQKGEKITMLTCYDYSTAKLLEEAGIDFILVGDSLGTVVLGYDTTLPVTMDVMIHHAKAVVRGTSKALVVGDMPFMTYHTSTEDCLRNAARFLQEAGCQAIKLEGGVTVADKVKRCIECGIPVMGHIGLTPQSVNAFGGHKLQGKTKEAAARLVQDAIALDQAGAFAIVLETIPAALGTLITQKVNCPTIGIGAGPGCDGQVQVINDMLGSFTDFVPRHAKQYAHLATIIKDAASQYDKEVKSGAFPTAKNSFAMDESLLEGLK